YGDVTRKIDGANDHLATLAIAVLNRHTLYNPIDGQGYPKDSDVRPFRLVWKAMRALDDKIHWQEMNRVLMWVNYNHEEDAAIEHIRQIRKTLAGPYDAKSLAKLGKTAVKEDEETKRRITPWFSRAGFGGILITGEDDEDGFRRLVPTYKHLIDRALKLDLPFPAESVVSRQAYLKYLADESVITQQATSVGDEADIARVLKAIERYGRTKIICLSGIPATGKTRLAKLVASRLTENDPYRYDEIQFHETTTYEDFMEGFVPKPSGEGFELVRKTFREINRRARLDPAGKTYVLLIEEFTRTNVHAVLGELLTYIEHRDRAFRLALSQEQEKIAPNLVVLATMNPRDKSALVLDDAITRRLHRIPVDASIGALRAMLKEKLEETLLVQLVGWVEQYQKVLPFGQGAFVDARSAEDLHEIWTATLRHFLLDVSGEIRDRYKELDQKFPWR
ncbi:MAG: AAA family ATPase, partial [Acidobacteriia bacterium]|nr:AAA family ATPase [Terriglobia bacterium]